MTTALVVIDMQQGMADRVAAGRQLVEPGAPAKVARLLSAFRDAGLPVIHVHHDDPDPASPFRRGAPGGAPMDCARPAAGEPVLWKAASSAFAGTGLDALLRRIGAQDIVIAGAVAAFCVTSSTRAASDLGFRVILPRDALLGFDIAGIDGGRIDADTVMMVTLSLLGADFAQVSRTDEIASRLSAGQ